MHYGHHFRGCVFVDLLAKGTSLHITIGFDNMNGSITKQFVIIFIKVNNKKSDVNTWCDNCRLRCPSTHASDEVP